MTFQTGVILCLAVFVSGAAVLAFIAIRGIQKEASDK